LGNYISETGIIEGAKVEVVLGHLSSIEVNTNQATTPEQQIGLSGSTGCSSAPHVHLSVLVDGDYVDPMLVLP
jgi:murein DD-endopeptidase MepM/ murein hydrolase activator NlpD